MNGGQMIEVARQIGRMVGTSKRWTVNPADPTQVERTQFTVLMQYGFGPAIDEQAAPDVEEVLLEITDGCWLIEIELRSIHLNLSAAWNPEAREWAKVRGSINREPIASSAAAFERVVARLLTDGEWGKSVADLDSEIEPAAAAVA